MREHADVAADVGEHEQGRAGYRAAGAQMLLAGIEADRAAAGEDIDRLVTARAAVELGKHLGKQFVHLLGVELRRELGLGGHWRGSPGYEPAQSTGSAAQLQEVRDLLFRLASRAPIKRASYEKIA